MVDEKSSRNQAYVLLNVEYKHQKDIINKAKSLSAVTNVKTMYGIYDLMIILESNDMGAIKRNYKHDITSHCWYSWRNFRIRIARI